MAVNLSPVAGAAAQFLDNSGNVLTGGKLYTYAAGTTTPQVTYTSSAGITALPNPIILDAAGRVPTGEIWLTDSLVYKFVLKDSNDVLIATWDNLVGINSNYVNFTVQEEIQTATAGQTVFNLTTISYTPGSNSLQVFVDGVNQYDGSSYAYVETNSTTVTFTSGLHVGALVKFTNAISNSSGIDTDASLVTYDPPFTGGVATTVESKLAQTVSVKDFGAVGDGVADDTTAIQDALDSGASTVIFPDGTYKITTSLIPDSDTTLVINGILNIPFHAYTAIRIDAKSNINIIGSGAIQGYGNFPAKNISGVSGGEKHLTTSASLVWPQGTNGNVTSLGTYGGGYLGNGGHGVFITGSDDITVNIEIFGFNYDGVCIGDPTDNNNPAAVVSTNIQISGYIHDCYNSGVTYSVCENVVISNLVLYNIGGPTVVISDPIIDPGYGTTALSMGASGIPAKNVTQTGITTTLCRRRGIDIHSGYYISTGNCTIDQSWIAGVGGMVSGGYHSNLTFSNITISNSANATAVVADAPSAFAMGAPFTTASDINIYESARSYGVFVYADSVSLSNIVINNPTYTALNRPLYALNVSKLNVDGFRVRGMFNDSLFLDTVTLSAVNNINTSNTSWTTGLYDLEMNACSVYIGSANIWSRRQFNIGNTGQMEGRRARVTFSCNGTATPDYTIVDGAPYVGSVSFASNFAYVYAIASSNFAGVTTGAGMATFSARTDIGTADEIKSINTFTGSSGGAVYAATGLYKDNTNRAALNSANLNGTIFVTDVVWAFQ